MACRPQNASLGDRIDNLVGEYRQALVRTERTPPWELAHQLLAFGDAARVTLVNGSEDEPIPYLVFRARGHADGSRLFAPGAGGVALPATDVPPRRRYQDHRNQMLATIVQVTIERMPEEPRPVGIDRPTWQALLAGAWADYSVREDPSWTLICYVVVGRELPGAPAAVSARVREMVQVLVAPPRDLALACNGAHALHALAVYLRSPYADEFGASVNDRVRARLDAGLGNALRWHHLTGTRGAGQGLRAADDLIGMYGHTIEWLVAYLPPDRLRDAEVLKLVEALAERLRAARGFDLSPNGSVCHGLRALRLFRDATAQRDTRHDKD